MTRRVRPMDKKLNDMLIKAGQREPETEEEAVSRRMSELLSDLSRRFSRATEIGRGIQLDAAEVDLMTMHGAFAVISEAAVKALTQQATERTMRRIKKEVSGGF